MNDRMYADAATQANLATLRERGVTRDRARRGRARLARRARHAAACPSPSALLAELEALLPAAARRLGRPAGAGHRRRHPRADRPGPLHRQPLQRPHGPGAGRGRRAARRRGDADRRQRLAAAPRRGPDGRGRDDRRARPRPCGRSSPSSHVLADGGGAGRLSRRRSPADRRSLASEGAGLELRLEPTEDILAARGAGAPRRSDVVGFAAETGPAAIERARAKLERKGVDAIVFNDVSRAEIGFDSSRERGHDRRARGRAPRARSRPRTRSPRRSSTASRRCAQARSVA